MNPRETRFIAEYLVDFNGAQAAIRAGYSSKGSKVCAARLLTKPEIKAAIESRREKQIANTDLSAARVLEELRRLAFSDIRTLFDETGNLRPLQELTAEQAACIASVEVVIKNAKAGDGVTDTVHKIKVWDKPRTLEMLAKHFALLTEVVKLDAEDALVQALMAGRKRAAEVSKGPAR